MKKFFKESIVVKTFAVVYLPQEIGTHFSDPSNEIANKASELRKRDPLKMKLSLVDLFPTYLSVSIQIQQLTFSIKNYPESTLF